MTESNSPEKFMQTLTEDVKSLYFGDLSTPDLNRLAAKLLYTQLELGTQIRAASLDLRGKKDSLKTLRGAVYLEECRKSEKKPTETMLECLVNTNTMVTEAQQSFGFAEARIEELNNTLNVAREAHVFVRTLLTQYVIK